VPENFIRDNDDRTGTVEEAGRNSGKTSQVVCMSWLKKWQRRHLFDVSSPHPLTLLYFSAGRILAISRKNVKRKT